MNDDLYLVIASDLHAGRLLHEKLCVQSSEMVDYELFR